MHSSHPFQKQDILYVLCTLQQTVSVQGKQIKSRLVRGWGEGRMNRQSTEVLQQWNSFVRYYNGGYVSLLWHLSKFIECETSRVNPNVNFGLLMIMICQCRFISCNNCTPLGEALIVGGGGCTYVRIERMWELSVLSTQLCCESKTALSLLI